MKLFLLFAVVLVLAVVHVNGRSSRCTYLKCRSRTGRFTGCSSKRVKGNINSIKVVKIYGTEKCIPGRNYVLHFRNQRVMAVSGKCDALFEVCFTLASDPYQCYYYTKYQKKLIRKGKTTYEAVCKKHCGIYRKKFTPLRLGCGNCDCCKWRD